MVVVVSGLVASRGWKGEPPHLTDKRLCTRPSRLGRPHCWPEKAGFRSTWPQAALPPSLQPLPARGGHLSLTAGWG